MNPFSDSLPTDIQAKLPIWLIKYSFRQGTKMSQPKWISRCCLFLTSKSFFLRLQTFPVSCLRSVFIATSDGSYIMQLQQVELYQSSAINSLKRLDETVQSRGTFGFWLAQHRYVPPSLSGGQTPSTSVIIIISKAFLLCN